MANDGVPRSVPASVATAPAVSGNSLPPGGKAANKPGEAAGAPTGSAGESAARASATRAPAQATAPAAKAGLHALLTQLNKYLNDSGRPTQFRIDPSSRDRIIQEINPATGEVIGEFAASEFPALARSLGVSGMLVDSHA